MELKVLQGGVRIETVNFPINGTYIKRKVRTNLPKNMFYRFIHLNLTEKDREIIGEKKYFYEYVS